MNKCMYSQHYEWHQGLSKFIAISSIGVLTSAVDYGSRVLAVQSASSVKIGRTGSNDRRCHLKSP